ncbi:MAG: class I SAM-dependent methyltransferase [Pedobacter sp.]|nr:MAG: class I SAM-dependent methyltransferase [Pedobacter sp.]
MLANYFRKLVDLTPKFAVFFWKTFYNTATFLFKKKWEWKFMNYGYAELNMYAAEYEILCSQMYAHLANQIEIMPTDHILEVGCGRGGGCEFLLKYHPLQVTGLDFSNQAIQFCKSNYQAKNLNFEVGNAEALPFPDASFDIIFNIESSHCYGNRDQFFKEVIRCLKPNGYFLYADFMGTIHFPKREAQLKLRGFKVLNQSDITPHVLKSMDLSIPYKESILKQVPLKIVRNALVDFVGLPGSDIYQKLKANQSIYFSFVCQKPVE